MVCKGRSAVQATSVYSRACRPGCQWQDAVCRAHVFICALAFPSRLALSQQVCMRNCIMRQHHPLLASSRSGKAADLQLQTAASSAVLPAVVEKTGCSCLTDLTIDVPGSRWLIRWSYPTAGLIDALHVAAFSGWDPFLEDFIAYASQIWLRAGCHTATMPQGQFAAHEASQAWRSSAYPSRGLDYVVKLQGISYSLNAQ